ncbi:MAG: hypothetical protein GF401_10355 [Chitinivibrionales bacterium]|nr:hypothetical protein [Chitinivibrionales bacterium]
MMANTFFPHGDTIDLKIVAKNRGLSNLSNNVMVSIFVYLPEPSLYILSIFDISGRLILKRYGLRPIDKHVELVDVNILKPKTYIVQINHRTKSIVTRFVLSNSPSHHCAAPEFTV